MKKKSLGIMCASLAICGTAVFGTYAWLTATDGPITNNFATTTDSKNIEIDLAEPAWTETVKNDAKDYIPGDKFAKDPTVQNISKKNTLFAAIKVTYVVDNKPTDATGFNTLAKFDKINEGWTKIGTYTDGSELYMYNTLLAKDAYTAPLFNSVEINKTITETKKFDITVEGFGTQAENATPDEVKASLIAISGATAIRP